MLEIARGLHRSMNPFWLFISLGSFFEVLGDIYFRKQSYLAGIILYGLGTLLWALSLRYETLSKAVILFGVLNTLAAVLAGRMVFNESLTAFQWVGVGLGLGCLAILS